MNIEFNGEVWYWKGPSPFHFITVPEEQCLDLREASSVVSYGWGMIPVKAQIGRSGWTTSLWPRNGQYIVPVKDAVRRAEQIRVGDIVSVGLLVDV